MSTPYLPYTVAFPALSLQRTLLPRVQNSLPIAQFIEYLILDATTFFKNLEKIRATKLSLIRLAAEVSGKFMWLYDCYSIKNL